MARPLSEDLRSRLVAAVDGGMSRRAAAERSGVSAARGPLGPGIAHVTCPATFSLRRQPHTRRPLMRRRLEFDILRP